jgi:hypothetical protein
VREFEFVALVALMLGELKGRRTRLRLGFIVLDKFEAVYFFVWVAGWCC